MAHNGILFLDELPEFQRIALEALRQPLEDQKIQINRANFEIEYPANFLLATAMNPCPCGYYSDKSRDCRCSPTSISKYWKKISGPILDRIDIILGLDRLEKGDMNQKTPEENSTESTQKRSDRTREIQNRRNKSRKANAQLSQKEIAEHCTLDKESQEFIDQKEEDQ